MSEAIAAPDLIAACEALLERCEQFSVQGVYFDEPCMTENVNAISQARAAIARAKGGDA